MRRSKLPYDVVVVANCLLDSGRGERLVPVIFCSFYSFRAEPAHPCGASQGMCYGAFTSPPCEA